MKFGTIVWIKAGDNRLVDQRVKVLRTGAGIVLCKTFAEHDNFITVPYDRICGIEMEEGH